MRERNFHPMKVRRLDTPGAQFPAQLCAAISHASVIA
jgi:hypothetical protein